MSRIISFSTSSSSTTFKGVSKKSIFQAEKKSFFYAENERIKHKYIEILKYRYGKSSNTIKKEIYALAEFEEFNK